MVFITAILESKLRNHEHSVDIENESIRGYVSSGSLNIREMQIKVITIYHHTIIRLTFTKKMIRGVKVDISALLVRTLIIQLLWKMEW